MLICYSLRHTSNVSTQYSGVLILGRDKD